MEGNIYELAVVLSPDLSEFDVQKVMEKIKTSITSKGGVIQKEHTWGKKRLAYPIGKAEFGNYQTLVFDSPRAAIAEIDKDTRLTPEIIRHLIISLEKEGIAVDQLFTPEKESALIATLAKEKLEPSKPHQTRASRGRITPEVAKIAEPEILDNTPVSEDKMEPSFAEATEGLAETADEAAKRRAELDKKLDELLKEE